MSALVIAWIAAGLAVFACLALFLKGRGAVERAELAEAELGEARDAAKAQRKQLEKRERQREGRGADTSDIRRRLEKAKKRTAQLLEERRQEPEQIAALEQQVAQGKSELAAMREDLGHLSLKLERTQRADPVPAPAPAPPQPPTEDALLQAQRREEQNEALRGRVAKLESRLKMAEQSAEQSRTRIKTQDKLYLAMRGELEVKKDRLQRQQEELERLMALRATLLPEAASDGEAATEEA